MLTLIIYKDAVNAFYKHRIAGEKEEIEIPVIICASIS